MVLDKKIIDNIKVIESMLFYYEIIETIEFSELNNVEISNFILNIVGEKLKLVIGDDVYKEYTDTLIEI